VHGFPVETNSLQGISVEEAKNKRLSKIILCAGIPCAKLMSMHGFSAKNQFQCRDSLIQNNFHLRISRAKSISMQGFPVANQFSCRDFLCQINFCSGISWGKSISM